VRIVEEFDKIKSMEVRCQNPVCRKWFASTMFFFEDMESFKSSHLEGNTTQCPHCGRITGSDKENMWVISEKDEYRGKDTC
jgi:hypothetical protein